MERMPVKFAKYYKFAFVRNPWSRLVSCYAYDNLVTKDFQLGGKFHGISFKNYIHERFTNGEAHWSCPQVDYLKIDGYLVTDFIGRCENMQADFDFVCKAVGLPQIQLPRHRKTKHKPYQEYYDKESEEAVRIAFQRDIDEFEYTFD